MQKFLVRFRAIALLALVIAVSAGSTLSLVSRPARADESLPWQDKSAPFGVVATLGNRVREDEIDTAVMLMREAGIQWQREELFWDRVQQTPGGPFTWTGNGNGFYNYDRAIEAQVNAGINVLGLLDYNPAWFKGKNPHPDEWIDDWGNFVYNAVARYGRDRGWITYWELWNEPNLAPSGYESGLYTVEDFVRILEVGRAAAKAADPEAQIVMGGLASIWGQPTTANNYDYYDYLLAVAEAGGWDQVDILAIHLYRPDAPEGDIQGTRRSAMDLRTELDHLDEFLRTYGPKPIWITEIGWPTHAIWPGVDPDTQAFFMVRMYVLALAHPSVQKIFWYDLRNDTVPEAPYHQPVYHPDFDQLHYGLLNRTYPLDSNRPDLRKPSFLAYRTMTQMLGNVSLNEVALSGEDPEKTEVYWYRFRSDNRRVDVLWRTTDLNPNIPVTCDCREAQVRSWNGRLKYVLYTNDGNLNLHLPEHGAPMYVEYDPPVPNDGLHIEATGHTMRGAFKDYWGQQGGMARFGNPLTDELIEPEPGSGRPRTVQYFERARMVYYPEYAGTPDAVHIGNPGHDYLQYRGIDWQTLPKATNVITGTRYFTETGHTLQPPFLETWEAYGGMRMLGYPLSEAFEEQHPVNKKTYLVQYFERARLEYHPKHKGKPEEIQFGSLVREMITHWGGIP
jgi:hypothetical protein